MCYSVINSKVIAKTLLSSKNMNAMIFINLQIIKLIGHHYQKAKTLQITSARPYIITLLSVYLRNISFSSITGYVWI